MRDQLARELSAFEELIPNDELRAWKQEVDAWTAFVESKSPWKATPAKRPQSPYALPEDKSMPVDAAGGVVF